MNRKIQTLKMLNRQHRQQELESKVTFSNSMHGKVETAGAIKWYNFNIWSHVNR
jgi:hypothetical protein